MTTTENDIDKKQNPFLGIYLLEMTTTENGIQVKLFVEEGIYLLEMTTTENFLGSNKTDL